MADSLSSAADAGKKRRHVSREWALVVVTILSVDQGNFHHQTLSCLRMPATATAPPFVRLRGYRANLDRHTRLLAVSRPWQIVPDHLARSDVAPSI